MLCPNRTNVAIGIIVWFDVAFAILVWLCGTLLPPCSLLVSGSMWHCHSCPALWTPLTPRPLLVLCSIAIPVRLCGTLLLPCPAW